MRAERLEKPVAFVFLGLCLFFGGYWLGSDHPTNSVPGSQKPVVYLCSMHPDYRLEQMGTCALCGMDLIEGQVAGPENLGPGQLFLSASAQSRAAIEVTAVTHKWVEHELHLMGTVVYNEQKTTVLPALISGQVHQLYQDYTGGPIKAGEPLLQLFSDEMLTAQRMYLDARIIQDKAAFQLHSPNHLRLLASRERLLSWGFDQEALKELDRSQEPSPFQQINAPVSGTLVAKHVAVGDGVRKGQPLFTIADLSQVWLELEAYESDLPWLRFGQRVSFATDALPGEFFEGTLVHLDHQLNPRTRTLKVRVWMANPDRKLKANIWGHGLIYARDFAGERDNSASAGQWVSPLYPEITANAPGYCKRSGLPLVAAAQMVSEPQGDHLSKAPLVIPATAPLITGTRALVYLALPDQEGVFEGREVVLGPRSGDFYVVKQGLREGDRVVTHGNFKIDSELQIRAGKSMMYRSWDEDQQPVDGKIDSRKIDSRKIDSRKIDPAFRQSFQPLLVSYFSMQEAFSKDQASEGSRCAGVMLKALAAVPHQPLDIRAQKLWSEQAELLRGILAEMAGDNHLETLRQRFHTLSQAITRNIKTFAIQDPAIYRFHCPMAFQNTGADWLQNNDQIANPYFGSMMYSCGARVEIISAGSSHK